jgi:histone deacetylase 11
MLTEEKLPIVYSDKYNISFNGLEKLHPFDSKKYGRVFEMLSERIGFTRTNVHEPIAITDEELIEIHQPEYLASLKNSSTVAEIAEVDILGMLPNSILQSGLLTPMRFATAGTLMGADLALKHGWAINLSGGYHHAKRDSGSGFCFFADIPLAVMKLRKAKPGIKVLIIDLDAHQGNGISDSLQLFSDVSILDVYNCEIYPNDIAAEKCIHFPCPILGGIEDADYLSLVGRVVPEAMVASEADFVIYNAGTDIYQDDPLGAMGVSREGIIKRDEIVFANAIDRDTPILMLLSGGYTKTSASIIADSIENLMTRVISVS